MPSEATQEGARDRAPLVELKGVSKHFGGTIALQDIDFDLRRGEVHGLVGENGAGKSTLMKILSGVYSGYEGQYLLEGREVHLSGPAAAKHHGIGMVHQELSVIDQLTVAENVFLGRQPTGRAGVVDWAAMRTGAHDHLQELGIDVPVKARLATLPFGVRQMVEIAKVVFSGAGIVILDEPTSALSHHETRRLFSLIRTLRERGKSIVFISHLLDDVLEVCDRVTAFRNGRKVATVDRGACDKRLLIEMMIGKDRHIKTVGQDASVRLPPRSAAPVRLAVKHLTRRGQFEDVSFEVHAGEAVGLYGLMGAGHAALGTCLFGLQASDAGEVAVDGELTRLTSPIRAKAAGIAYTPEDRRRSLVQTAEISKNITLPYLERILGPRAAWLIKSKREDAVARQQMAELRVKADSPRRRVDTLSGGNQQKVVLGKWLCFPPKVIVLAEPTRGIDVAAKADIAEHVAQMKEKGLAIVVISNEPETIMAMSDRILAFSKGRVVAELCDTVTTKAQMMEIL